MLAELLVDSYLEDQGLSPIGLPLEKKEQKRTEGASS
jgi:hypothetical protein